MTQEQLSYLKSIEMTDTVIQRVELLVSIGERIIKHNVNEIFVSDSLDAENIRRYNNLLLFFGNIVSECKNFITSDNIDFLNSNPSYIEMTYSNFDMIRSSGNSRMTCTIRVGLAAAAVLFSTGNNCDVMLDLLRRRFLSKLSERGTAQLFAG